MEQISNAEAALKDIDKQYEKVSDQVGKLGASYVSASAGLRSINGEIDDMTAIIGKSADEVAREQEAIENATGAAAELVAFNANRVSNAAQTFYDEVNGIAGVTLSLNGKMVDLSDTTATSIGALLDTYDQLVEKQRNAIESSINFFGGFEKTNAGFDTMWENLDQTADGLTNWATGIEQLESRDISGALLQELKDMGLDSYGYVMALYHASDEQLTAYSNLWDKTQASVQDVTNRMVAGQKEKIEDQLRELAGVPKGPIEDFKEAYYNMGIAADEGFAKGVDAKLKEAAKSGSDMAQEAIDDTMDTLDAHSPSRRFEDIGRMVARGFALGMNDKSVMSEISTAARNMANEAIASVREALDEHSPSKVLRKIGGFFSEGFELGINDNAGMAEESAMMMANSAAESAYIEPSVGSITANTQAADSQLDRQATINLSVDGQLMASVLAPLLDVISGRNIMLATRGRQL